ncbi:MAG: ATP-binding protein [Pseudomonadota bacterium]|jgi:PAS domain S-box-containing protein
MLRRLLSALWGARRRNEAAEPSQAETDVEDLRRRLREAEDVIRLTENLASVGFWRFEPRTGIRSWSPSIFEIFGLDPAKGAPESGGIDMFDPEHRDHLRAVVAGLDAGGTLDQEYGITRGDGRKAYIRMTGRLERGPDGGVTRMYGAIVDITEAHRREQALQEKTREAEAATVAKSEFLANMSHEIRTPLTAVIGYAGLMAKIADLPEKARVYADRVVRSGEALNEIVDRILDFSKIEAGRITLKPEPARLAEMIQAALEQVRPAAEAKGLTISAEIVEPAPEGVLVDRARLIQVIINLLNNAIRFTSTGAVRLVARHDLETQRLHVSVEDTGAGIEPEAVERLFQRFVQAESNNARRFGGVGLGLAIAKGLVELMEGEIRAVSTPGEGSTFSFFVSAPAVDLSADDEVVGEEASADLDSIRILMADDVAANRELVGALLSPFAPRITEAADGAEAVDLAGREPFDVILMDVQMPGMDGLEATRTIRRDSTINRDTPVIAISASVLPRDVQACLDAGMNDHVPKPISPRDLITKINRCVAGAGAARAAG